MRTSWKLVKDSVRNWFQGILQIKFGVCWTLAKWFVGHWFGGLLEIVLGIGWNLINGSAGLGSQVGGKVF